MVTARQQGPWNQKNVQNESTNSGSLSHLCLNEIVWNNIIRRMDRQNYISEMMYMLKPLQSFKVSF